MMNEKLDLLNYMAENGYDFEDLTMDDFMKYTSVEFLREIVRNMLDDYPD